MPDLPPARERLRALRVLPDNAQVPVWYIRDLVDGSEPFDGIGTADAAELLGIEDDPTEVRRLRRLHSTWDRMLDRGERPPVRVSRKGSSARSDLLFDRNDLAGWADKNARADLSLIEAVP